MNTFELEGNEFIPLCDLLKTMGMCENGGQAKAVIAEGLVQVDGQTETRKRCKVRTGQIVKFNGEEILVK